MQPYRPDVELPMSVMLPDDLNTQYHEAYEVNQNTSSSQWSFYLLLLALKTARTKLQPETGSKIQGMGRLK